LIKKICFVQLKVIGYFKPDLNVTPGGAERQIFQLMKYCAQQSELSVHGCVGDFGQDQHISIENINLWKSCALQGNLVYRVWRLFKTLKQIDADIYVFRSPDIGVALGALLVRLLKRNFLYMVANEDEAIPKNLQSICGFWGSRAMAWVYGSADHLVTQTQQQADLFLKHRKISVSGIIPNMFWKNPEMVPPSDFSPNLKKGYSIWVGRCDRIKRCEIFLDLVEQHPDNTFVMICPRTTDKVYWNEVSLRAISLKNLHFIEKVDPSEIHIWYQNASLLLMTSVSEGFSNVMMEALYEKCPLLTLNVNPDNIIPRFNLGQTFNDEAIDLFFKAFNDLHNNPNQLKLMGESGRRYIEQFHGIDQTGQRFISMLSKGSELHRS
jgi:glycosyltransferase involved in cell wall biosynthesis